MNDNRKETQNQKDKGGNEDGDDKEGEWGDAGEETIRVGREWEKTIGRGGEIVVAENENETGKMDKEEERLKRRRYGEEEEER